MQTDKRRPQEMPIQRLADILPTELRGNPNLSGALSSHLQDPIRFHRSWEANQPIDRTLFDAIKEHILADIEALENPYHNRKHTEEVIECIEILCQLTKENVISESDKELLRLAALFHDYQHCGQRYRQLANKEDNLSNEEFAAIAADSYLKDHLTIEQRVQLQGLILATSFGQGYDELTNKGKNNLSKETSALIRSYVPYTVPEKLLAFADIGRFLLGSETHFDGSLRLMQESGNIPNSFDEWIASEKGFLGYVNMKVAAIKEHLTSQGQQVLDEKLTDLADFYGKTVLTDPRYKERYNQVVEKKI